MRPADVGLGAARGRLRLRYLVGRLEVVRHLGHDFALLRRVDDLEVARPRPAPVQAVLRVVDDLHLLALVGLAQLVREHLQHVRLLADHGRARRRRLHRGVRAVLPEVRAVPALAPRTDRRRHVVAVLVGEVLPKLARVAHLLQITHSSTDRKKQTERENGAIAAPHQPESQQEAMTELTLTLPTQLPHGPTCVSLFSINRPA
jgi:hypothetical protein